MPNADGGHVAAQQARPTVLVVEDDVVLRYLLADVLRDEAHCDVTAVDFDEAIERRELDLIVTDLPGSRYASAQARDWVRSLRERFPATPIVVCTAHRQADKEPDRLGADALLPKPFEIAELLRTTELLTVRGSPSAATPSGVLQPATAPRV
jgi:CheY-like chemotaxis protein